MEKEINAGTFENMTLLVALIDERRYFDNAIVTTVTATLTANGALLAILQYLDTSAFGKLMPFIGVASVFISAFTVRLHRNRYDYADRNGFSLQSWLAERIELPIKPFRDTASDSRFSAPDMIHIVLLIMWAGIFSRRIPIVDSFLDSIWAKIVSFFG